MVAVTKFDERHCHKWALLLRERREKLNKITGCLAIEDFDVAKRLFREVFYGFTAGKHSDPGMAGSLLYHMAMVTKMETETKFLLTDFQVDLRGIEAPLWRFYGEFASDADELTRTIMPPNMNVREVASKGSLGSDEKVSLFIELARKTKELECMLNDGNLEGVEYLEGLFQGWSQCIIEMRLRQEYETIKGLLVTAELVKTVGIPQLSDAMAKHKKSSVTKP